MMEQIPAHPTAAEMARLSRGAPMFSVLIVGLAALACLDTPSTTKQAMDRKVADCSAWDQQAVEGITPLLYGDNATAERKLNEALTQLRRARAFCKAGSLRVAMNDYVSLHRALPTSTGSIRPVSNPTPHPPVSTIYFPK